MIPTKRISFSSADEYNEYWMKDESEIIKK